MNTWVKEAHYFTLRHLPTFKIKERISYA